MQNPPFMLLICAHFLECPFQIHNAPCLCIRLTCYFTYTVCMINHLCPTFLTRATYESQPLCALLLWAADCCDSVLCIFRALLLCGWFFSAECQCGSSSCKEPAAEDSEQGERTLRLSPSSWQLLSGPCKCCPILPHTSPGMATDFLGQELCMPLSSRSLIPQPNYHSLWVSSLGTSQCLANHSREQTMRRDLPKWVHASWYKYAVWIHPTLIHFLLTKSEMTADHLLPNLALGAVHLNREMQDFLA